MLNEERVQEADDKQHHGAVGHWQPLDCGTAHLCSAKDVPSTERLDETRRTQQSGRIHEDKRARDASLDGAELERQIHGYIRAVCSG